MLVGYGQLFTTAGTASAQHATSVLGGHSLAETMLIYAATIVGLECSFHLFIVLTYYSEV